jgi:hypothetical protein
VKHCHGTVELGLYGGVARDREMYAPKFLATAVLVHVYLLGMRKRLEETKKDCRAR